MEPAMTATTQQTTLSPKERLIVALDVGTADEARQIFAELRDSVCSFKIGLQLYTVAGPDFVRKLVDSRAKIFLDLKFHDIPNTVAKAAVEAARLGVWMFNVHAIGGSEMMRRTVCEVNDVCESESLERPKIIAVTVLTSSDSAAMLEIGINENIESAVVNLARLSAECGLDGVVASANEIEAIRTNVDNKDFLIVTPGIRPSFATNDDQRRVMTPGLAVRSGSDYLVIGRPILQSEDRVGTIKGIIEEMSSAA